MNGNLGTGIMDSGPELIIIHGQVATSTCISHRLKVTIMPGVIINRHENVTDLSEITLPIPCNNLNYLIDEKQVLNRI